MSRPTHVYRRFIEFEELAAKIYLRLAARFPKNEYLGAFWLEMAMQEKQHAGLLQFCVEEGCFACDLPDTAGTEKIAELFKRLEERSANTQLTIAGAFSLAIELETSEVNAIYRRLTSSLHNSTYLARRKIATSLPDHVEELVHAARQFGVADQAIQTLSSLKESAGPRRGAATSETRP